MSITSCSIRPIFLGGTTRPYHRSSSRCFGEIDGPTLQHAIQGIHGQRILLPGKKIEQPDIEFLSERYERFLEVAGRGKSAEGPATVGWLSTGGIPPYAKTWSGWLVTL